MSEAVTGISFGQRAANLGSMEGLISLERESERHAFFAELDTLSSSLIARSLNGEKIINVKHSIEKSKIVILGLDSSKQRLLDNWFSVEHQHSKGAWFLPEKASLKTGLANLPATFKSYPRFAHRITMEDWSSVTLAESPAGLMVWSILEPFFYDLFLPLEMRASWSGLKTREDHLSAWEAIDKFVTALGLGLDKQLRIFRYGGGWGGCRAVSRLKPNRTCCRRLQTR
jgi:hypothetical protein